MINLDQVESIYFIGIGGIAMSATAGIAKNLGFKVAGSDSQDVYEPARSVLEKNKIVYFAGYDENQIKNSGADLFVISAGENLTNPEVKYVYDQHLPHVSFAELLYEFSKDKLRVVVAGTHGKSTTTGLLGHLLRQLDDSSFLVGAVLQNYETNFYKGSGHYFVFEGDEYKSEFDDPTPKFHYYRPDILVLTNLEFDHPDRFETFEELKQEVSHLIANLPEDGLVVYNADDAELCKLVHDSNVTKVSFGIDNSADYQAVQIKYDQAFTNLEVHNKFSRDFVTQLIGQTEQYKIQLPGKLNVYNSLAAVAVLRTLGFKSNEIALDLLAYKGVKRRFETVAVKNSITVIDDYAHHPTAVSQTLEAARLKFPSQRIWAVFEPHTFSRTRATLGELGKSFIKADEVLISKIYPAREKISQATITSQEVVEEIRKQQPNVRLVENQKQALEILSKEAKAGDVIVIMAVGDFNRLAYNLKALL